MPFEQKNGGNQAHRATQQQLAGDVESCRAGLGALYSTASAEGGAFAGFKVHTPTVLTGGRHIRRAIPLQREPIYERSAKDHLHGNRRSP